MSQPPDPLRFIARYFKCRRHVDIPKILLVAPPDHRLDTGILNTPSEIFPYAQCSSIPLGEGVVWVKLVCNRYILWAAILQCKHWLYHTRRFCLDKVYVALNIAKSTGVVTIDRRNVLRRYRKKRVRIHTHTNTPEISNILLLYMYYLPASIWPLQHIRIPIIFCIHVHVAVFHVVGIFYAKCLLVKIIENTDIVLRCIMYLRKYCICIGKRPKEMEKKMFSFILHNILKNTITIK